MQPCRFKVILCVTTSFLTKAARQILKIYIFRPPSHLACHLAHTYQGLGVCWSVQCFLCSALTVHVRANENYLLEYWMPGLVIRVIWWSGSPAFTHSPTLHTNEDEVYHYLGHYTYFSAEYSLTWNNHCKLLCWYSKGTGLYVAHIEQSYLPCIASISHLQWSYGVTCWELFTGGKIPYPGVDPISLSNHLENGHRLDKPNNAACSEEMLVVLATTHSSKREEVWWLTCQAGVCCTCRHNQNTVNARAQHGHTRFNNFCAKCRGN